MNPTKSSVLVVAAFAFLTCPIGMSRAAPDDGGQCAFNITPPRTVQVGSATMVTATMAAGACTIPTAVPSESLVCLKLVGDAGAGQCANAVASNTAEVFFQYGPGRTYIATGRGCVTRQDPPNLLCQSLGPLSATL